MKINSFVFIFVFFVIFTFSFQAFADEKMKIGVSLALTGNAAGYGKDILNSFQFANQELTGGKYQLIVEDDMCSSKEAVSAAHKLVNIDKVPYVLGELCSGTMLSTAPIFENSKVVVISSSAGAAGISKAGDYIFRTRISDERSGSLLYTYVSKHHQRFGVLSEQTDYCQGMIHSFLEGNQPEHLSVFVENFLTNEPDLRSQILRFKQKGIDFVLRVVGANGQVRLL